MQKFVVFTDPNKDVDDLIAIMMLSSMQKDNLLKIVGIVSTHGNDETTYKRACFSQAVSNLLGNNLTVCAGIGKKLEDVNKDRSSNAFFAYDGINEIMNNCDKAKVQTNSLSYLTNVFKKAVDNSLDMLILAQMTDIWNFVSKKPDLFLNKVRNVTIMGMYNKVNNEFVPDNSTNNVNDIEAANNFYKFLQDNNILTNFINRFAVKKVAVTLTLFKGFAKANKQLGNYILNAEEASLKKLYEGLFNNEALKRQTPEWFYENFTDIPQSEYEYFKNGGADEKYTNEVMNHMVKLNLYDPLTLIAAIDKFSNLFDYKSENNFRTLTPHSKAEIHQLFQKYLTNNK